MIDFIIGIRTRLWNGVNLEGVSKYLNELVASKQKINDIALEYQWTLYGSKSLIEQMNNALNEQIEICNFYLDHLNRMQEKDFNQWVFTKKEDVPNLYGWIKATCDQWTKTNGRIKAKIELDRSGAMTKITLSYDNDSKHLKFYDSYRHKDDETVTHAKNEQSIEERIELLKARADIFLKLNQYPQGMWSVTTLNELMHIE